MDAVATKARPSAKTRRMFGVRATAEERRIIAEAVQPEDRSVSTFVLCARARRGEDSVHDAEGQS